MNIDDLYITNYREFGGLPLKSITRLSTADAYALAESLSAKSKSKRDRYGAYFSTYYPKRLRTEEWLYHSFLSLGGKPQTRHPIYFVLHESAALCEYFGHGDVRKILLKEIDSSHISFTPRDSMHLMDMEKTEGTVWRKETLLAMVEESELGIVDCIKRIPEQYGQIGGYIEVQLWNDDYLDRI